MHQVNLKAKMRDNTGKNFCKKVRQAGGVPAVIYGNKMENVLVSVDTSEFVKAITSSAGTRIIVNLNVESGKETKEYTTMISEIQKDVFQKKYFHIDFHKVSLDEKTHSDVPVTLRGESKGVKNGGMLDQLIWRIQVEALPLDLPEKIEIDITNLEEGQSISVKDIVLPEGVHSLVDASEMIAIVHAPKVAREETPAEPVAAAGKGKGKK
ncbi:MAG: 50S ribosomal protein L25 [Firmicutes bacterium]|nr:50S ribosomal protein L25 [Bacillota bacterium]